ncbi:MAG: hypothetical protein ABSB80_05775 [Methanoregula sp.]|uniref:hypothetical protein n=1 Tax=Methanoregula sp. TaxID=2052170 RepID=UPI003D0E0930
MRIGNRCINCSIGCSPSSTFGLGTTTTPLSTATILMGFCVAGLAATRLVRR